MDNQQKYANLISCTSNKAKNALLKVIATAIRNARVEQHLDRDVLAHRCGIDRRVLIGIENAHLDITRLPSSLLEMLVLELGIVEEQRNQLLYLASLVADEKVKETH